MLSTIRCYIEALGGSLELHAVFADRDIPITTRNRLGPGPVKVADDRATTRGASTSQETDRPVLKARSATEMTSRERAVFCASHAAVIEPSPRNRRQSTN